MRRRREKRDVATADTPLEETSHAARARGPQRRGTTHDTGTILSATAVQIFVIDDALPECYFERMGVLVLVLGLCCAGLLLLAGLLWVMVRGRSEAGTSPASLLQSGIMADTKPAARSTIFVHPRMDLASGRIPPNQAVDLDRRRARQMVNASVPWHSRKAGFEPFAERRTLQRTRRQRLDLVYAREGMGDLSDPDIRPAGQWRMSDLQTALPAK